MAVFDLDKKVKRLNGNIIYRLIMQHEHYIDVRSMNFLMVKTGRWTTVIIFRQMPAKLPHPRQLLLHCPNTVLPVHMLTPLTYVRVGNAIAYAGLH